MLELRFETELTADHKIPVPSSVAKEIPAHAKVSVALRIADDRSFAEEKTKQQRPSNDALEYYMHHPIKMTGIPPFHREDVYRERTGS
jgi:hypothetical protein